MKYLMYDDLDNLQKMYFRFVFDHPGGIFNILYSDGTTNLTYVRWTLNFVKLKKERQMTKDKVETTGNILDFYYRQREHYKSKLVPSTLVYKEGAFAYRITHNHTFMVVPVNNFSFAELIPLRDNLTPEISKALSIEDRIRFFTALLQDYSLIQWVKTLPWKDVP